MSYSLHPIYTYYHCAVRNKWEYDCIISKYGRENVKFGALHYCFKSSENEFIFSRAVAMLQDLILV